MVRLLVLVVVVVVTVGSACDVDCNTVEPSYGGDATDEVWRVMLDARPSAEAGDDVAVTEPEAGSVLTKSDSGRLAWTSSLQVAALTPLISAPAQPARRRAPSLVDHLFGLVIPAARAHLPPVTSDVYLAEIDVPGRQCPVAALTTDESFTLSEADWSAVTDEPGERTLRVLGAFLTENRVTEGPFSAAAVKFTVE